MQSPPGLFRRILSIRSLKYKQMFVSVLYSCERKPSRFSGTSGEAALFRELLRRPPSSFARIAKVDSIMNTLDLERLEGVESLAQTAESSSEPLVIIDRHGREALVAMSPDVLERLLFDTSILNCDPDGWIRS